MAGFAEALAQSLDHHSPEALAGKVGDLIQAIDLAYGAPERDRAVAPAPDAASMHDIALRIGFDLHALIDG
jgi:hypothetical protein